MNLTHYPRTTRKAPATCAVCGRPVERVKATNGAGYFLRHK